MSQPSDERLSVGVDLGGTKIEARLLDKRGSTVAEARAATPPAGGLEVVAEIATLVRSVTADRDPKTIAGVGVGAAGIIDPESGEVLDATDSIPGWKGVRIASELAQRTGWPVRAINDVHAHALGEFSLAGLPLDASLLLVAVGTGVGGGYVLGGAVLGGAHWAAGHFGHIASSFADGLPCSCGGRGHVEASGSGPAIRDTYRRLGGSASDAFEVAARAVEGDERARAAIDLSATSVGSVVGGLVNCLDPDLVVVSGGVPRIPGWWQTFEAAARQEALPLLASVPLRPSAGDAAACLGAASLVMEKERTP